MTLISRFSTAFAIVAMANAARFLVDSHPFIAGRRRLRYNYGWFRTSDKAVQDEISQLPDLRLTEFRSPGKHGSSGHTIGDCGNQSFARNRAAEGGIGEIARRRYEALLRMPCPIPSVAMTYGAIQAVTLAHGVLSRDGAG